MRIRNHVTIVALTLLTGTLLGGCNGLTGWIDKKTRINNARTRVEAMMEGILKGDSATNNDRYRSISLWFKGVKTLDTASASIATDKFDVWQRQKQIFPTIDSYEITDAVIDENDDRAVFVYVTVDGTKDLKMRVVERDTIAWAK